jgi:DHA1 family bicyclomycin/chloramphenicol resistance-like MFS transporter
VDGERTEVDTTTGGGAHARRRRGQAAPGSREFLGIVALCMAMAALSIDLLLPAFPAMREAFGLEPDATEISRVITAFFVGLGLGQLVYGPLSDRFGRKRVLYVGIAIYVAGAIAATQAGSLPSFVLCRVVWGFGAACPRSLALAILRDTFEGDRMARVMSNVMATFILVPIVAPSLGSALLALGDWHLTLWVPVVIASVLVVWTGFRLPETLPPERRRSVAPSALLVAAGAVVRNRQTMAFCLASTFLFGIMTAYIGSTQVIIDEVFGMGRLFPVIFGVLAIGLALGSLVSARLVTRVGLARLVRTGVVYAVFTTGLLALVGVGSAGHPPLWLFLVASALMLPSVTALVPNTNTAAMAPLGHVAGMAAAIIGTISTIGGALLGSVVDRAYDGSVRPFTVAGFTFALAACASVFLARTPATAADPDLVLDGDVAPAFLD